MAAACQRQSIRRATACGTIASGSTPPAVPFRWIRRRNMGHVSNSRCRCKAHEDALASITSRCQAVAGDLVTMTLRIGIVEDDTQLRADFAQLVEGASDMSCVGAFTSAEEAVDGLGAAAADVVLMDINLPGMSGIECVRRLRAKNVTPQVVMLTTFDDTAL